MSIFDKPDISFKPLDVETLDVRSGAKDVLSSELTQADVDKAIVNKLIDHLSLIKAYNDRIDAIDYLIDNAKKLAGNLSYTTDNPSLIMSIESLGGNGNTIDFKLFEKAVDVVIQGYKEMALISLTGVAK
jgi:hypothetical protein